MGWRVFDGPSNQVAVSPSATPIYTSGRRIAVRIVGDEAEFYDRQTGEEFIPRGANYVRLAPHASLGETYHSTFDPGLYDAAHAESVLVGMAALGYNTARVFIDQNEVVEPSGEFSGAYLDNLTDFLGRAALESVAGQTHPPLEVLVVDDGSTDGSAAIAEGFGPPVRCIRQEHGGIGGCGRRRATTWPFSTRTTCGRPPSLPPRWPCWRTSRGPTRSSPA